MATITESMQEKGITLKNTREWKDSPTTPNYTDFSKLDLNNIRIGKNVIVSSKGTLLEEKYENVIDDNSDPMVNLNRELHNFSASMDLSGDTRITFGENDSVIGVIKINAAADSNLFIDLGKYRFLNLIMLVNVESGVNSTIILKSNESGISYLRIKQILHDKSNLDMVNLHTKNSFMFFRGDAELHENSELKSRLYLYSDGSAHYDAIQNVLYNGENSKAVVLGNGIVDGNSSLVFRGMLTMHMERCYGSFDTKTLNISTGRAFADSIPMLDVGANNVTAKHSSSIEDIDKKKLFYLMTRGLDEKESKDLIIEAFLDTKTT